MGIPLSQRTPAAYLHVAQDSLPNWPGDISLNISSVLDHCSVFQFFTHPWLLQVDETATLHLFFYFRRLHHSYCKLIDGNAKRQNCSFFLLSKDTLCSLDRVGTTGYRLQVYNGYVLSTIVQLHLALSTRASLFYGKCANNL